MQVDLKINYKKKLNLMVFGEVIEGAAWSAWRIHTSCISLVSL
jgi:hypothetical protein